MCLSIIVKYPDREIETGVLSGLEYVITHNNNGFRCGYVKIPHGHPWHGKNYNDLRDVEVHGGLSFSEPDYPCGKEEDDGWWIGFDCAQKYDRLDPSLPNSHSCYFPAFGTIKDTEYVRQECAKLALLIRKSQ